MGADENTADPESIKNHIRDLSNNRENYTPDLSYTKQEGTIISRVGIYRKTKTTDSSPFGIGQANPPGGESGEGRTISIMKGSVTDRSEAIDAAVLLNDKSATPLLIDIAMNKDEPLSLRLAAIYALGEIGDKRAVEPLLGMLNDSNKQIEQASVFALGQMTARWDELGFSRFWDSHWRNKTTAELEKRKGKTDGDTKAMIAVALLKFDGWQREHEPKKIAKAEPEPKTRKTTPQTQ